MTGGEGMKRIFCNDIPNEFGSPCCGSCHHDEEMGYESFSNYGNCDAEGLEFHICCKRIADDMPDQRRQQLYEHLRRLP